MFVLWACFRVSFRISGLPEKQAYVAESLVLLEENRKPWFWARWSCQDHLPGSLLISQYIDFP